MFRKGTKHQYRLTFVQASGLPDGETVSLYWKRGAKGENEGETPRKPVVGGRVSWHESVSIVCTLFPSGVPGCYDSKLALFTIQKYKNDKPTTLGKVSLDLAEFAGTGGTMTTRSLTVKPMKRGAGGPYTLVISVSSTLLATDVDEVPSAQVAETDAGVEADPLDFEDKEAATTGAALDGATGDRSPSPASLSTDTPTKKEKRRSKRFGRKNESNSDQVAKQELLLVHRVLEAALDAEFVPPGMPRTVLVIMTHLASGGPIEHVSPSIVASTVSALGVARKAHAWSFTAVMHWLSAAWWLVREVTPRLPPGHPVKEPQYVRQPPAKPEGSSPEKELLYVLQQFLFDYFLIALERAYRDLRSAVPAIPESARHRAHRQGSPRVTVSSVLYDARSAMLDARLAEPVRQQYFTQLTTFVNSTLLNLLLSTPQFCTCKAGLQVLLELSLIDEFIATDPPIAAARQKLEGVRQAANLLVMNKSVLLDESATKASFPLLSWTQIHRLVSTFKPDDVSREKIDRAVIGAVAARAQRSPAPSAVVEDATRFEAPPDR